MRSKPTFLLELRVAARDCSNVEYRKLLKDAADAVSEAIDALYDAPTRENAVAMNGAWAHAHRLLENIPPEAPPAPLSGWTEPARLAA